MSIQNDLLLRIVEQLEQRLASLDIPGAIDDVRMIKRLVKNPDLLEELAIRMASDDLVEYGEFEIEENEDGK